MADDSVGGHHHAHTDTFTVFKTFTVAHLNIRSINTGFDEFSSYMDTYQFDIMGLSETWLSQYYDSASFTIPNYNFIRKDRNGRGGGVGIYIKKHIKFTEVNFNLVSPDVEHISIEILHNKKRILFTCFYRPPSGDIDNFIDTLDNIFSQTIPVYDYVVFLGDQNVDFLSDTLSKKKLERLIIVYNLNQLIRDPTRINLSTGSSSLIDIILTNSNLPVLKAESVPVSHTLTDHNLIYAALNLKKMECPAKFVLSRDYKNIDPERFRLDAQQLAWDSIYYENNIDRKLDILNNNILYLINKHAPLQRKKVRKKNIAPWITDNIKLLMRLRDKAHSKYLKNKTPAKLQTYRELRNYTKHALIREKISYFNQFSLKKGKEFWNNANRLNLTKDEAREIPANISDPNLLNTYYWSCSQITNSVSKDKINFYNSNIYPNITSNLHFTLLNENILLSIINKISTYSTGEDEISIRDLRHCLPYCINPILNIINSCILESHFPALWKKAIIIPIPKVTNPKEPKDLRPISILPVLSKVLERHIYCQIFDFVNNLKIIPDCQSGFRPNFSTSTSLVKLLNDIRYFEDNKNVTCLALLDFSKAFDTLDHRMLLAKLHYFGFSPSSIKFMMLYLQNKFHCVQIRKEFCLLKSDHLPLITGVPQGSILGPLLFSLYVADMYNCVQNSKVLQYADDSQIYSSFTLNNLNNSLEQFNSDLSRLNGFSTDHNLKLNASKSCYILFNTNKNIENYISENFRPVIENVHLPLVGEAKNLGVIFDKNLTFQSHINNKLRIAYMRLKKLNNLKSFLPSKTKYFLCDTLILSLFDSADVVYGNSLTAQISHSIQKLQNTRIRFSFDIPFQSHITPHLNSFDILNMTNRRKYHMYRVSR